MTTRSQDEIERQRYEQGQAFIKQLNDMFQAQRQDMDQKYVPRVETEARFDHLEQVVERIGLAVEKVTGNVGIFHENAPRIFADRADTKQDIAELRTEIEKLKTAREGDMQRGYGFRIEDMQGRYEGDMRGERGWRKAQAQQLTVTNGQLMAGAFLLITIAVNVFLAMHH